VTGWSFYETTVGFDISLTSDFSKAYSIIGSGIVAQCWECLIQLARMKELRPSIRKNLPPLKLYLEDIEFLVKRLESISSRITIKTDTHEFENISEFSNTQKEALRKLQILSRDPYLIVELNQLSASLYLSEDRPDARGVFEQIKSHLQKRRKFFTAIFFSPIFFIPSIAFCLLVAPLISRFVPSSFQLFALLAWLFLYVCAGCLFLFLHNRRYNIIIPKRRSDAPSFWERNWEKIVIGVLTGLLGLLIGWLIKFLPGPK
jgi:hypothetical protein